MSDRSTTTRPPRPATTHGGAAAIPRWLHDRFPNSTQLTGILTLVVSAAILLLLTGLGLTATILTLIFFFPIILFTIPIWFPVAAFLFVVVSFVAFAAATVAAATWLYRYFRGLHPPGSDRFDYARSRIATTAREVNDYAREYGGYLHSKIKDAAPGA